MQKTCSIGMEKRSGFYQLGQQDKQLQIMEMSEAWRDIDDEGYMHQFQLGPNHKVFKLFCIEVFEKNPPTDVNCMI